MSKAIELDAKYSKAFHRRAQALEKLGKKQDALTDLTVVAILEKFNETSLYATDRLLKEIAQEQLGTIQVN